MTGDADLARHVEPELGKLVLQIRLGDVVQTVKRNGGIGTAEGYTAALRGEDSAV